MAQLDDGEAMLIADETDDAKSSTDAVAAAHQYSGSLGGVGLCQVAVHLTFAASREHPIIDRALYLTQDRAVDEVRRELTGVPEQLAFATKPALAAAMLARAHAAGVRASFFFEADEVSGRWRCGAPAAPSVWVTRSRSAPTTGSPPDQWMTCKDALKLVPGRAWQRMRTGTGSRGARDYDRAMLEVVADDDPDRQTGAGFSVLLAPRPPIHPAPSPSSLGLLPLLNLPAPERDPRTRCAGPSGAAATKFERVHATSTSRPTPTSRHENQHPTEDHDLQLPCRCAMVPVW